VSDEWLEVSGSPCIVTMPDGYGEAVVRGRRWRWDYMEWGGPIFVNADGSDRRVRPSERHPVWKAFARWLRRRSKR
jgi:hypothetical protein